MFFLGAENWVCDVSIFWLMDDGGAGGRGGGFVLLLYDIRRQGGAFL